MRSHPPYHHTRRRCVFRPVRHPRAAGRLVSLLLSGLLLTACTLTLPEPPAANLPTQPAVLEITPAPTLDIDATATVMAEQLRPTPTPAGLYIVQEGDTLSDLADRFNTTVEEILVANDLNDPNDLQSGQELIIPSLVPTPAIGTPDEERADEEAADDSDAEEAPSEDDAEAEAEDTEEAPVDEADEAESDATSDGATDAEDEADAEETAP